MLKLKETASAAVQAAKGELRELSSEIWNHPELGFEEYKAHAILTLFLEQKGFSVDRSFSGIKTAFRATFGSGKPNVCVICEYDALPEIGHACGHNLIAEAGVAAGLGVKAALESDGAPPGKLTVMGTPAEEGGGGKVTLMENGEFTDIDIARKLTVMGTPAEEGGGGKVTLMENGEFTDIDIAMMVHPAPYTIIKPKFIAIAIYTVTFTGKGCHAATHPWEGVNALDAAVTAYNSISVLRQQMKPNWRVHMIITNGGTKGNIIPEKTAMEVWVRAPTRDEIKILTDKVKTCVEAAALATSCQYSFKLDGNMFDNLHSNDTLARLYAENLKQKGFIEFVDSYEETGSTDMGNVSHTVPSIHPMFKIGTGEVYHTREFASVTNIASSHDSTLLFAEAMAHTCIDILTNNDLLQAAKSEFESGQ